jgi:hypothetical protein
MADLYNTLGDRKRYDTANFHQLTGRQRSVLAEFDRDYLQRCRRLLSEMHGFEYDSEQQQTIRNFQQNIDEWEDESRRLGRGL